MKSSLLMSFADLQLVTELEKFRSLRALSRSLGQEPANVKKKIDRMAELLGFELYESTPRGYSLTIEGERLIGVAKKLLALYSESLDKDRSQSQADRHLAVTGRGYLVSYFVKSLLHDFCRKFQNVGFRFTDSSPAAAERLGRDGSVSLIFSTGDLDLGSSWSQEQIGTFSWLYVVRKDHPLKRDVKLKELSKYPIVESCYFENDRLVRRLNQPLVKGMIAHHEAENVGFFKEIIKNSDSVALLPSLSVIEDLQRGDLRQLQLSELEIKKSPVVVHGHNDLLRSNEWTAIVKSLTSSLKITNDSNYSP